MLGERGRVEIILESLFINRSFKRLLKVSVLRKMRSSEQLNNFSGTITDYSLESGLEEVWSLQHPHER